MLNLLGKSKIAETICSKKTSLVDEIFKFQPMKYIHTAILSKKKNVRSFKVFSKKTSRYCHIPGVSVVGVVQKLLTFSNISVITEDIYLKLRTVAHHKKGNPYQ